MSTDPLDALRAAAPVAAPPGPQARDSAWHAAIAQSPIAGSTPSLRRWWAAVTAAVLGGALVVAGTAVPAIGDQGPAPAPSPRPADVSVSGGVDPHELYLTRPDGTVYTIAPSPDPEEAS